MAAVTDLRCALLCRRMVEGCPQLRWLFIDSDADTVRDIVTGLQNVRMNNASGRGLRPILLSVLGR